jgi:hypothetical protein
MRSVLKHKRADQPIGPGEVSIDVEGRELKLTTFRGIETLPLDFVALEPRDENASGQVYVFREDGVAHIEPFRAGGGGQADHGYAWRVPGLTPTGIISQAVTDTWDALFEVQRPTTIQRLRLRVEAGSGTVILSIRALDGSPLTSVLETAPGAGDIARGVSVPLDPGRYIARVVVTAPMTLRMIQGRLPWTRAVQAHPLMMEIA